jgi:DNA invertase Pin-like site-specific DNA recombinase
MTPVDPFAVNRPAKIRPQHLERLAVVYVRQSDPYQILRHPESAPVQINLRERALEWGWAAKRIIVLDGDQGCSATTTKDRDDFAFLLSEIALGHVGLVFGFQFNRLSREDEASCRLIRYCATFDTLVADMDGVYHPKEFNDHMLLTLKGFFGGIELHHIQQRMQAGRLQRARRGEWLGQPPPGYIVGASGKLQFDPDEQVQQVIRLILDQFAALGSVSGVLRYMQQHQIQMPFRPLSGPQRGQLLWRRPFRETLRLLVRRPAYAGAFTWGLHTVDRSRLAPGQRGTTRLERQPDECPVFIRDNHAAYLSWEQYQSNLSRLKQHRIRGPKPSEARKTVSLLAGLVMCGQCGCRMQTRYTRTLRYVCQRHALDYGTPPCQSVAGMPLDRLITEQVLQVVTPAALELSLRAAQECERERAALNQHWRLRLERAAQEVERAYRQYNRVEPENRLVARSLERKWEEALLAKQTLEEEHHRFEQAQPTQLSAAERAQIEALAHDLPALWQSPQTSVPDKRQVVRLLLQQALVWAPASSQEVRVQLHWIGGTVTEHQVQRPVHTWKQMSEEAVLRERLRAWQAAGWTSRQIAEELNRTGQSTPRGKSFTAESIRQLLSRIQRQNVKARSRKKKHKVAQTSKPRS